MSLHSFLKNPKLPVEVKDAFKHAIVSSCPEQAMWREAAMRLTLDAFGLAGEDDEGAVEEARIWYRDCYDDVRLLFEFAGVEPSPVLAALKRNGLI